MKIKLAPSLERADWLNLESEIRKLEEAEVDLLHIDIMDRTFGETILFSPKIVPALKEITHIPLDIHMYVENPEQYFPLLFSCCKNDYINIEIESVKGITKLLTLIRNAECKPAVTVDIGTPICVLEELIPYVDMVNLLIRSSGCPHVELGDQILNKIRKVRKMFDENGRKDVEIAVDGSVSFEDVNILVESGANILVLGTKIVFRPGHTYKENCEQLRLILQVLA